ncbi:hypothetical protein P3T76_005899 [Phytophthora citrophthora]|uniref:Uncharacterized protein n=1 Tax=Phytophthora citrophthora TaxID=4793 RepID=A0AAD9GPI4_9STRA|nr:hypothetical protein P3T76_005899 [Phytophthora citrophthora]
MTELLGRDDPSTSSAGIHVNPFDAASSDRDPFPSFDAALADESEETEQLESVSALDWSIDTLAELKPAAFSPLPQQKDAANMSTPLGASSFFEDETQYEVLRTPLTAARASTTSRNSTILAVASSPSPVSELHRCCRETITNCEASLRERQRKMDKMQGVLPPPTPKRSLLPGPSNQRATPPSRSTPPRSTKRNRLSTIVTPKNEWKSPATRPPMWSASPIASVSRRRPLCATPSTLQFDALTPLPLANSPRNTTPTQSSKLRLSFGLSPITFPSSEQVEEKIEEEASGEGKSNNEDTLPLSSSTEESAVSESEEENGDDEQASTEGDGYQSSSSSHDTMRTPAKKTMTIPRRRQQAFMEAMEAEARSSSYCSSNRSPRTVKPST